MPPNQPPKLTHTQLAQSRVIARGTKIKDIQRLLAEYGGVVSKWVKKSSPPLMIENRLAEIHWYEYPDLAKSNTKLSG